MPVWDPDAYLAFAAYRARPFHDLVARAGDVLGRDPATIVDLGCGPGQLSPVLRARWPHADVLGVDSSAEMIERAQRDNTDPLTRYRLDDVTTWRADSPVDLIISNATFQWVPSRRELIPRLRDELAPSGVLAFSVPDNYAAPSHVLLHELADTPPYAAHLAAVPRQRGTGAAEFLDLLASTDWEVDAWTTTYLHVLPGDDAVFRWIGGTGARPFLQALPDDLRPGFEQEYAARLRAAYPAGELGTVLPFERVFVLTWPRS